MDKRVLVGLAVVILVIAISVTFASGGVFTGNVIKNSSKNNESEIEVNLKIEGPKEGVKYNETFNLTWNSNGEKCNGYGNYVPLENKKEFWNLESELENQGERQLRAVFALGGNLDKISYKNNLQIGIQCWSKENNHVRDTVKVPVKRPDKEETASGKEKISVGEIYSFQEDSSIKLKEINSEKAKFEINISNKSKETEIKEGNSRKIFGKTYMELVKVFGSQGPNNSRQEHVEIIFRESVKISGNKTDPDEKDLDEKENEKKVDDKEDSNEKEPTKRGCYDNAGGTYDCYLPKGEIVKSPQDEYEFEINTLEKEFVILDVGEKITDKIREDERYNLKGKDVIKIEEIGQKRVVIEFISGNLQNSERSNNVKGEYCDNCNVDGKCVPVGYRSQNEYCSIDKGMIAQLQEGEQCKNNFECESNICVSGECVSQGVFDKFVEWLNGVFN